MSVSLISPAMWQVQPWRNGGGTTQELLCKQDASGIIWRVSIARVEQNGNFSLFPGIDRIFMLLEGNGCSLNFANGKEQIINKTLQPFSFSGDSEIYCRLLTSKIRDLNLMTRRSLLKSSCTIIQLPLVMQTKQYKINSEIILFVASGNAIVHVNQHKYTLAHEDLLHIKNEQGTLIINSNLANTAMVLFYLTKETA